MKQKIFSLLLLMFAATGAWADDTYKIVLSMTDGEYSGSKSIPEAAISTTASVTLSLADIVEVAADAFDHSYPKAQFDCQFDYEGESGVVFNASCDEDDASVTGTGSTTEIKIGPLGGTYHLTSTRSFSIPLKFTGKDGTDVAGQTFTPIGILKVDVYHNAHSWTSPDVWESNDTHHWNACSNGYGQCDESADSKQNYAAHTYENGVCTVCQSPEPSSLPDPGTGHGHTFEGSWSHIPEGHYHKCTTSESDYQCIFSATNGGYTAEKLATVAEAAFAEHDYTGADPNTCTVCGYVKAPTHVHNYSGITNNETTHWIPCISQVGTCDAPKKDEAAHVYDDQATDAAYWTCSVCNFVNNVRKAAAPHTHSYSSSWVNNDPDNHWHACESTIGTCDAPKSDLAAHVYGTSQEGTAYYTCKVCGYVNETRQNEEHTHAYSTTYSHDDDYHWKECTQTAGPCNAPIFEKAAHGYGTTGDARWTCQTCTWVNEARKVAVQNADAALASQAWKWDYEIPYDFEGPVLNDRKLNAGQCYTVCLPYALSLSGLKAYYVEQSSDNLVGFHEQSLTSLPALQPCVIKADATGTPLNAASVVVNKTIDITDRGAIVPIAPAAATTQSNKHSFFGSLKYIAAADAEGKYILQGKDDAHPEGSFKKIPDAAGSYTDVDHQYCILPMRAYLAAPAAGPARMFLDVVFYAADGSTTAVERIAIDQDAAPVIFDLQGRRVQNPRKGGLYIINGRKSILK